MTDTIVWVHGFPLSASLFARQRVIPGFHHIAPDLPGFGTAAPLEGKPSMDAYAREVLRSMDAAGVDRATLAGVSMGGYVLFALLRIAPERVERLILVSTRETPDSDEQRKGRYGMMEKIAAQGMQPVIDSMLPKMLTKDAARELIDEVQAIMSEATPAGAVAALDAMAERGDSAGVLSRIAVPVLVIAGEDDPIIPPSDADRMATLIPHARAIVIPGAAHLPNIQQSQRFNDEVSAFLTASSGSAR